MSPLLMNIYVISLGNPGILAKARKFQLADTSFRDFHTIKPDCGGSGNLNQNMEAERRTSYFRQTFPVMHLFGNFALREIVLWSGKVNDIGISKMSCLFVQ